MQKWKSKTEYRKQKITKKLKDRKLETKYKNRDIEATSKDEQLGTHHIDMSYLLPNL